MPDNIQQRTELDFNAIDDQIKAWIKDGHAPDDIVAQAKHTWPSLPEDYVRASLRLIRHMMTLETPLPLQPLRDISMVHRKRGKRIRKLEAQLDADDAPVSLQTLYRSLLRDHEAACHKILALQRQDDLDRQKEAKDAVKEQRQADQRYAKQL